jgi:hypothetical protein
MQYLAEFMAGFDYVHSKPAPDWITAKPTYLVASVLAAGSRDYAAYLADSREVTDASAGQPIGGKVVFGLPAGRFAVRLYSPASGGYSPGVIIDGGKPVALEVGPFQDDIAIRATRMDE